MTRISNMRKAQASRMQNIFESGEQGVHINDALNKCSEETKIMHEELKEKQIESMPLEWKKKYRRLAIRRYYLESEYLQGVIETAKKEGAFRSIIESYERFENVARINLEKYRKWEVN